MKKRVLIGMSGGVDSSVSAALLQDKGYEVIGITMNFYGDNTENKDAKLVCEKLNIKHYECNFKKEFNEKVIENFVCQYKVCNTPNPCIECNKYMKFGLMYEKAKELNCDYIATGHYALTEYSDKYNRVVIKKSKSIKKDQTYVLYQLNPNILNKLIFPLGEFETKDEIRKIALEKGLVVANKPDSEDICFIPNNNYVEFLEKEKGFKPKEGNIVDKKGNILGKHNGLYKYTIGQRKGLGIAYKVPLYVIGFNIKNNELIVGEENELYKDTVYLDNFNNLLGIDIHNLKVKAKIRYASKEAEATMYKENNKIKIVFNEKQRAITPGQSLVVYLEDIVLGGGII